MNVFFEFHKLVLELQQRGVRYALIGGVAMAFHAQARFTRDVDFLVEPGQLEEVRAILTKAGYVESASPWTFTNGLTLHRFLRVVDGDEMMVDLLLAGTPRQQAVIGKALDFESTGTGVVRVATKSDLIWLKTQRNSALDRADIEALSEEKHDDES